MRTYFLFIVCYFLKEVGTTVKGSDKSEEHGVSLDRDFLTDHTFIALIDIVFTDGSKRICTGAIVDDTVVITAAHCFTIKSDPHVVPELTASFVVIGTRKMFDSGYEQYLPIERVITHPDYHGWRADLSLVFTFAAMTADKPGTIIHLAGEKIVDKLDSNITIISWGSGDDLPSTKLVAPTKKTEKPCSGSDSDDEVELNEASKEIGRNGNEKKNRDSERAEAGASEKSVEYKDRYREPDEDQRHDRDSSHGQREHRNSYSIRDPDSEPERGRGQNHDVTRFMRERYERKEDKTKWRNYRSTNLERLFPTTAHSRYLVKARIDSEKSRFLKRSHDRKSRVKSKYSSNSESRELTTTTTERYRRHTSLYHDNPIMKEGDIDKYIDSIYQRVSENMASTHQAQNKFKKHSNHRRELDPKTAAMEVEDTHFKSYYKNWRRSMGPQENQILVEIFSMIKLSDCKRLLERAVSSMYDNSEGNDFMCYTSDEHFITEHDSGAPAIKRNRLVAITLGGVECEGERVAIGLKMTCYCSWIASNIPNGNNITCCNDCCVEKNPHRWVD